jgi:hypothetical protein
VLNTVRQVSGAIGLALLTWMPGAVALLPAGGQELTV